MPFSSLRLTSSTLLVILLSVVIILVPESHALGRIVKQKGIVKPLIYSAPKDYYFSQEVDHFDLLNNATFQQRYWINDTFSNGKTILFAFAGEAPLDDFYGVSNNILAEMASEHKALLVYLEHRYYGKSMPINSTETSSLRYLSTDQALADAVYFYEWIQEQKMVEASPKMVTFGCSYSGMLSAFFRTKYPQLAVGAVAGSAPVEAVLDFPQYDQTVEDVLGSSCASVVKDAFMNISSIWKVNKDSLQGMFNVCQSLDSFALSDLTSALGGYVQGAVQGNNPDAGFPVDVMCKSLLGNSTLERAGLSSPLARFAAYIQSQSDGDCVDIDYISDLKQTGADRSWTFQTCTEYGFFQTDEGSKIFGGTIDLDYYLEACSKGFGVPLVPDTNLTNTRFGGFQQSGSNILFTNGLEDPWGVNLGINKPLSNNLNVTLYTGAHCAPFHPPTSKDPDNLVQSRVVMKDFVAQVLQQ